MEHEVFISYSSNDKAIADAICHVLEHHGITCWIAPRDVRPGEPYAREIISGIKNCQLMILVFTSNSNSSPHVGNEIDMAFNNGKTIIPFLIDDTPMNEELKYYLARKHWLVAYPDYEKRFEELLTAASNVLGRKLAPIDKRIETLALKEEKVEMVYLKVLSNMDCRVLIDCEEVGIAQEYKLFKIPLKYGDYYVQFVSVENEVDAIAVDFSINHDVLEKVDLKKIKEIREKKTLTNEVEYIPYVYEGKCGFVIEETMEIVIPCLYDAVFGFSEGLAKVKKNGKYGFINRNGTLVIPCEYSDAYNFSEGLSVVENHHHKRGVINNMGDIVVPFEYDFIYPYFAHSCGLLCVEKAGKDMVINRHGKDVITIDYEGIGPCMDNRISVKIDGKWGVWDSKGDCILHCKYDSISIFQEGLAIVILNGKRGYIDLFGIEVIPCKYDGASFFYENLAKVEINGKWGFIDKDGVEIIPCKYNDVGDFSNGYASVRIGSKWGFIDKNGIEVIPCIYDEVAPLGCPFRDLIIIRNGEVHKVINKLGQDVINLQDDWYPSIDLLEGHYNEGIIKMYNSDWGSGYMDKFGNNTLRISL